MPRTRGKQDAIEMLKVDHAKVRALFQQFDSAGRDERVSLAKEIYNQLEAHGRIEEDIFYPAIRDHIDSHTFTGLSEGEDLDLDSEDLDKESADDPTGSLMEEDELEDDEESDEDAIDRAYQDHQTVKVIIERLRKLDVGSPEYDEQFEELRESVMDHVSEEEAVIFPAAQAKLDLEELGARMQQKKAEQSRSEAA
ncbi:MAG: hemerythrin domain-containing protein [Nitrospiraceae bacterium]